MAMLFGICPIQDDWQGRRKRKEALGSQLPHSGSRVSHLALVLLQRSVGTIDAPTDIGKRLSVTIGGSRRKPYSEFGII